MFREMRRCNQAMTEEECRALLKEAKRGTLSVNGEDGYPYGVPVNFLFDERDGHIYVHGALEGHKLDAIAKDGRVCFTVIKEVSKKEDEWFWYVDSVICFGNATLVEDRELTAAKTRAIGEKYIPTQEEIDRTMEKHIDRVKLISIEIVHMTGKHVKEK